MQVLTMILLNDYVYGSTLSGRKNFLDCRDDAVYGILCRGRTSMHTYACGGDVIVHFADGAKQLDAAR
jgi:hypothetical protein